LTIYQRTIYPQPIYVKRSVILAATGNILMKGLPQTDNPEVNAIWGTKGSCYAAG
jgi:hypothetical protein